MKKQRIRVLILVAIALVFAIVATPAGSATPDVNIFYDAKQDEGCGSEIKEEWKAELRDRLDAFKTQWSLIGPPLIAATEKMTGRPFSLPAIQVRLTLCNAPSDSRGKIILVNMRYALKSFTPNPVSLQYKAGIVYHEILHKYLNDFAPGDSALLAAHRAESAMVKNHLHLLALMKDAYRELKLDAELQELIDNDNKLPSGVYKRAWGIINENEQTYRSFLTELKP